MTDSPPGGGTFSLEGRRAPGLYLVAWLLSGAGLALVVLAMLTDPPVRGVMLMGGLILLSAGLATAAGYQVLARRERPESAYRGPSPPVVFGFIFVVVNAFAVALVVLGLDIESPVGIAAALAVQSGGYFLFVWLFVVRSGALSWNDVDLARPWSGSRMLGDALYGAGIMVPTTFIILIATAIVFSVLQVPPPYVQPAPREPVPLLLLAVVVVLLVPVGEELFFRGFALTAWLRDLGERSALVRSSLFFALVHIINIRVVTFDEGARQALGVVLIILPVAVVLGLLFTRRGLMAAIAAHGTYNGIGYINRLVAESLPPPA